MTFRRLIYVSLCFVSRRKPLVLTTKRTNSPISFTSVLHQSYGPNVTREITCSQGGNTGDLSGMNVRHWRTIVCKATIPPVRLSLFFEHIYIALYHFCTFAGTVRVECTKYLIIIGTRYDCSTRENESKIRDEIWSFESWFSRKITFKIQQVRDYDSSNVSVHCSLVLLASTFVRTYADRGNLKNFIGRYESTILMFFPREKEIP